MSLEGKRILLGVSGSIAAYKACDLVRALGRAGAEVTVAMTEAATQFVGPTTFAALTSQPVMIRQFPDDPEAGVPHVEIAESFDLLVVAPATANILGKAAHAVADDLLSTLLSIMDCPVLFVPAMNHRMWNNPATQEAAGGTAVVEDNPHVFHSISTPRPADAANPLHHWQLTTSGGLSVVDLYRHARAWEG